MVNSLPLAQALTVLATMALSVTGVDAAVIHEREDTAIANVINPHKETYLSGIDLLKDEDLAKYTSDGLTLQMIKDQVLSLATWSASDQSKFSADDMPFYWFFNDTRLAAAKTDRDEGTGYGCQVVLLYDNIHKRFNMSSEQPNSAWDQPAHMAPWCNKGVDFVSDTTTGGAAYGFKELKPYTEPEWETLVVFLRSVDPLMSTCVGCRQLSEYTGINNLNSRPYSTLGGSRTNETAWADDIDSLWLGDPSPEKPVDETVNK
jgi:hypothetical protein